MSAGAVLGFQSPASINHECSSAGAPPHADDSADEPKSCRSVAAPRSVAYDRDNHTDGSGMLSLRTVTVAVAFSAKRLRTRTAKVNQRPACSALVGTVTNDSPPGREAGRAEQVFDAACPARKPVSREIFEQLGGVVLQSTFFPFDILACLCQRGSPLFEFGQLSRERAARPAA